METTNYLFRESLTQDEFNERANKVITNRAILRDYYTGVFTRIIRKYNGKILTKRLSNEVQKTIREHNALSWSITDKNPIHTYIELNIRIAQYNYTDKESIYIRIETDADNRIDADKTLSYNDIQYYDRKTQEIKDAVKNYKKYIKITQQLEDKIKEFNNLPEEYRRNINNILTIYYNR